jgi:threonine aldolase
LNSIDLRSDTMTRPTPAMRAAMAAAEVGDDYYQEDPTVNRLQERAAALLGFEAALFVPSGTMGNEIAIALLSAPGQLVLTEERSHVVEYELAGMAVHAGVMPRPILSEDGRLTAELIRAAVKPAAFNRPAAALVVLENTHNVAGGTVATVPDMQASIACAHDLGLRVHVDGARLWNAAVALGVEARSLVSGADTVMVTLSKGLCCPVGSLLLGSVDLVARGRRLRQLFGGGLRQSGVLAAAGLVALDTMIPRLADDHANARLLTDAMTGCAGVGVAPAQTNIAVAKLAAANAPEVAAALKERGVLATAMDRSTLRLVTHHDVSRADCERAANVVRSVLS